DKGTDRLLEIGAQPRAYAPNIDEFGCRGARYAHVRDMARQILKVPDIAFLKRRARHDRRRQWHILKTLLAALRGDDDFPRRNSVGLIGSLGCQSRRCI